MSKYTSVNYTSVMDASPGRMVPKQADLLDRDAGVGQALVSFAADARPGATLGVVSGRRRQGKSYLLQALAGRPPGAGIYFPALELTEAVSLRLFADEEPIRFTGSPVPPLRDWLDAIPYLLRVTGDRAVPVVIDEFPFLGQGITGAALHHRAGTGARGERVREPGPAAPVRVGDVGHGRPAVRAGAAARAGRSLACSSTPSATGTPHASGRSPTPRWPCWCMRWWVALPRTAGSWCGETPPRAWQASTPG